MENELSKNLKPFYEQLKPFIDNFSKIPLDECVTDTFTTCAKASFIKCFEFNYKIYTEEVKNESFYLIPFLRGICEDIITLKFLYTIEQSKRNEIVSVYSLLLQFESMHIQGEFFSNEFISEPVLITDKETIESMQNDLKILWKNLGYNKDTIFPSVKHMAVSTNMKGLYEYLYHATSRAVHFSPNHLMRTGWDNDKNDIYIFSISNFTNYYYQFLTFYSSYLFLKYVKEFKKILLLNNDFLRIIKDMKFTFRNLLHCPEIVTYEEMNKKRPLKITSLLADKSQRFKDSL